MPLPKAVQTRAAARASRAPGSAGDVTFTLVDAGDLKRINKLLRSLEDGKQLRKDLTQGMRAELRPIAREVQAAYRAAPEGGGLLSASRARRAQPDLRVLLAKATRLEVRLSGKLVGARIRVDGRRMPNRMKSLPAYWEGERSRRRWRHPVYGNREVWVQQPARPVFYPIVERHQSRVGRRVTELVGELARKIERA
jgi:hypothetical protein